MPAKLNLTLFFLSLFISGFAGNFTVFSPDKDITVEITVEKEISYSVFFEGKEVVQPSSINLTDNHTCWAGNWGYYITSQEKEFFERKIGDITPEMIIGLPLTVKADADCYLAITEAALTDYAGMYLKPDFQNGEFTMRTALSPRKGQPGNEDKVIFNTPHKTPWRVIMLGETPGDLVEPEIIQNLNEPCEIENPSWIKPALSAWDHWWSGEIKMEQPVILEYIDLASSMGWPYMLIDWQWYGMYNQPGADIKTPAPQLNMPEILGYAKSKKVKCWLWIHHTDVFRFDFEGKYKMTSFSDSEKTKENAEFAGKEKNIVQKDSKLKIKMVPGGGFAAWLELVQ